MNLPLTSVATANHVRKVGESFIAVVALAAAEEDLRVFLHVDTLLPKTADDTPMLFANSRICKTQALSTQRNICPTWPSVSCIPSLTVIVQC